MPNQTNLPLQQALVNACIMPDWTVPPQVKAYSTTRWGGVSLPPYDSLNLGAHTGDDPQAVAHNRQLLQQALQLPSEPAWLQQIHSGTPVELPALPTPQADAAYTHQANTVCAVLTADCMPVLFCNASGTCVAAAHAGWRGLAGGVLENTLSAAQFIPAHTSVWLGPAIGAQAFEVGEEVREAFVAHLPVAAQAFQPVLDKPGHWLADLYLLARQRLQHAGVTQIFGGGFCTLQNPQTFFSYRRDTITGRMATLIYYAENS